MKKMFFVAAALLALNVSSFAYAEEALPEIAPVDEIAPSAPDATAVDATAVDVAMPEAVDTAADPVNK